MTLKTTDWKVRLYLWTLEYRCDFHDKYFNRPYQTNLCEFMRSILIWFPLTILIQLTAIVSVFAALVYVPIVRFGSDFWKVPAWVLGAPAAVLLLILGITYLVAKFQKKQDDLEEERPYLTWEQKMKAAEEKERAFERSLIGMVTIWLKARKAAICPIIRLEDDHV